MEKFKEAMKAKVRFELNGRTYSVENLYDLSVKEVAEIGSSIEKKIQEQTGSTSYFNADKNVDSELNLKLEVVKAVYDDKVSDVKKEQKRRELTRKLDFLQRSQEMATLRAYEKMTAEELQKESEKIAEEITKLG